MLAAAVLADLRAFAAPRKPTSTVTTLSLPDAPARLAFVDCVCTAMKYFVALSCSVEIESEQGCRIYREGESIAGVRNNAKGFTVEPPGSGPHTHGVEA